VQVTPDDMRAAQGITLVTLALFLLTWRVPALRPHAHRVRVAIVALYLAGVTGFLVYLAVR
jgi:hypothetical protein